MKSHAALRAAWLNVGIEYYCGSQTLPTAQEANGFSAPRTSKWRCGPVARPVMPT